MLPAAAMAISKAAFSGMVGNTQTSAGGSRFQTGENEIAVDAEHVVHLSLSQKD